MKAFQLPARSLPLDDSWDVLVAGGGPAGCAAAAAAARDGAKTLLLEASAVLGGMGTAGLVPWFCGFHDHEKNIARGLAEQVRLKLADGMPHFKTALEKNPIATPPIHPELLKLIYDDMVTNAGAAVRFHSSLVSVETGADGEIAALIVADKSGLRAFRAKVYVDATGDGDLAARAGAPFEKGDTQGAMQPATMCFVMTNVDEAALQGGPAVHFYDPDSPVWKIVASPRYPLIEELHSCNIKIGPGSYGFNTGHVFDVDNTDPESLSQALLIGRRMAAQYREGFAEFHPAFAQAFLAATGSLLGVRETRRILGDYVLTESDYLGARHFPDEICRNAYGLDVHGSREAARACTKMSIPQLKERNRGIHRSLPPGQSVGVPFRCLIPQKLRNVLVAGRCISADRRANGCVRIMACCLNTGEAAGAAAAMAAARDGTVRHVTAPELRNRLKNAGAWLPGEDA